jgi:hypothetical protein
VWRRIVLNLKLEKKGINQLVPPYAVRWDVQGHHFVKDLSYSGACVVLLANYQSKWVVGGLVAGIGWKSIGMACK